MIEQGTILNSYRILEKIGQGGMSWVFTAEDLRTGARKVIKESLDNIYPEGRQNGVIHVSLEMELLTKLSHPGLPVIEDILTIDNKHLIVMEHIPGASLQDLVSKYGAQPLESVLDWIIQLCDILSYLHRQNPPIIFRDIKPSNIMLRPDGKIKLIDFGIARVYKEDEIKDTVLLGTRGYAAPEQYGGFGQTDIRTDIYGIGATVYHLISGHDPCRPPYLKKPITYWNPSLPIKLEKIIQKCLKADPEDRYSRCEEVLRELNIVRSKLSKTAPNGYTQVIAEKTGNYEVKILTDITCVHTNAVI